MVSTKRSNKKNIPSSVSSARQDRFVGKIISDLRAHGEHASIDVYRLKLKTPLVDLFAVFPRIFRDKNYLNSIHGHAFPSNLFELFAKPVLYQPADPLTEIIWAICRCLQFGEELQEFTQLREEYERSLLLNSQSRCSEILDDIETKFGNSIWLLQNRLSGAQFWDGIEVTRKMVQSYEHECKNHPLLPWLIRFIGKRIEATGLKGYLKSELLRIFEDDGEKILESYFRAKIFDLPHIDSNDVAATLFIEAQSCIVDYYETLIFVLQSAARNQAIPATIVSTIEKPLAVIFNRTRDGRLSAIMRALGFVPKTNVLYHEKRAELIEAYSRGDYRAMATGSESYLNGAPDDMSIQVMRLKACMQSDTPYSIQEGVLKEAFENLQNVLRAAENTYSNAFAIITLSERFYGHSWVHYLAAVVRNELDEEQAEYPPLTLRDLFIRDPYVSPFSALAANGKAKETILEDEKLRILFPYTRSVYDIVTTGKTDKLFPANEIREHKYLAIHHLSVGNPTQAANHFRWLIANTTGSEHIRCCGGAALALLKSSLLREAVDTTVTAYIENHNVPSILPISQITNALNDPSLWPDGISTPLLFELHSTYCDAERLPDLRYSFELFQLKNNIKEPSDLEKIISELDLPLVIAYLNNVWTPEVMRHTTLYGGTKEIEEARIKVCRLLGVLDPTNIANYQEEIKERVKQQAIAKGTTLIEQSKVYVEIEAIKKSLRAKLADSYERYKSSSQAKSANQEQSIYQKIAEVVSGIANESGVSVPLALSGLHNISTDIGSESDVQFEALFSEVTNEFLRGNHGLNAYLSTRVRHGTLSNTLRKPVADEKLITSREEGGASYIRNQYWKDAQKNSGEHLAEWETIMDALDKFSQEFDSVIEYIKNELIQIKVVHELKDKGENKNALFIYNSSNLERRFVQEQDRAFTNMDDFVNYYVDILWEKTDRNLLNVQRVLDKEIRERLMLPFETLTNCLTQLSTPGVGDLLNAVTKAKTNTQNRLGLVISWFKRSEVYDRQDYAPDFPFHIALNMIRNTMSDATGWDGATTNLHQESTVLPGRTLDGMVYVFYVLLENAVLRSGLSVGELFVNAEISYLDGIFNAKISNTISGEIATEDERRKLGKLREALKTDESPRRAQGEERSGLHKIWLTINSPIYKEPKLTFSQSEDLRFVVEMSFKIERPD